MQFWLGRQTEPLQIRKRCPYLQITGLQIFSIKGQVVNILGFVGQKVSVTTQLCHCHTKAARDNTSINGWRAVFQNAFISKNRQWT